MNHQVDNFKFISFSKQVLLEQIRRANQDLQYMKQTMKLDKNNKQMGKEFFDLQEKINMIVEEQEDIFATHMTAIKVDIVQLIHSLT